MNDHVRQMQDLLSRLGYEPGPVDGISGRQTRAAVERLLSGGGRPVVAWVEIAKGVRGMHETRDNAALKTFLASDGRTLGDPAKLPWCADMVQTCIRLALPSEPFTGPVEENPYWARNWLSFGRLCDPSYGAVAVFERGSGGHVAFLVAEDATHFHCLGGNQSDSVSVVRIAKGRALGFRWPISTPIAPTGSPCTSRCPPESP